MNLLSLFRLYYLVGGRVGIVVNESHREKLRPFGVKRDVAAYRSVFKIPRLRKGGVLVPPLKNIAVARSRPRLRFFALLYLHDFFQIVVTEIESQGKCFRLWLARSKSRKGDNYKRKSDKQKLFGFSHNFCLR